VELTRYTIDSSVEKQILTGMIVSSDFLKNIIPSYDSDYFRSSFVKRVSQWILEYYNIYNQAPLKNIESIYEAERERLDPNEATLIASFLSTLSREFEALESFNTDYHVQQTLRYYKKREIEIRARNALALVEKDKTEDAEAEMLGLKKISKATSNCYNPFEQRFIAESFAAKESDFFRFPGAFGDFVGPLRQGWTVLIAGKYKGFKCLKFDTKVVLSTGEWLNIEKIVKNKSSNILTLNDLKKVEESNCSDFVDNGIKDCYRLTTRSGRCIEVTSNEPFLTFKGWKELSELRKGEYIAVPRTIPFFGEITYPEHKLKLLGYLIADGCLLGSSIGYTKHSENVSGDVKTCVEKMGDTFKKSKGEIKGEYSIVRKIRKMHLCSETKGWLVELGLHGKKSRDKFIPDFVFTLNRQCISTFLKALFTGDSYLCQEKGHLNSSIVYKSASEFLVRQVQHLLLRFGIVSSFKSGRASYEKEGKLFDFYQIEIKSKEDVLQFINEIGFFHEKQQKAEKMKEDFSKLSGNRGHRDVFPNEYTLDIISRYPNYQHTALQNGKQKGCSIRRGTLKKIADELGDAAIKKDVDSDIFWDVVDSIKYIGKHQTYDLTVPDTHNFIANDFIVHNTSYCLEAAFLTSSSKIPTVYVSLEMLRPDINERLYKRITAYGEDASNIYIYPRFDCEMNQTGECNRNERENRVQLKTEENPNPEFTQDNPYRVCSWCRNNDPELYQQAIWFEAVERPKYTYDNVYQKIDDYSKYYGNDYLRVLCYPRFGASVNDVFRDLDMLEHIHGFVPKAVIWDQPEITRSDDRFKSDWESINNIWMRIVGRASEKGYLLFAPSQVTTEALGAAQIKSSNIGRARQILGHVDVAMAINTTTQANRMNVTKIGLLEHRHKKMFEDDELLILRNLDVGQAYLDSIIKRGSSR